MKHRLSISVRSKLSVFERIFGVKVSGHSLANFEYIGYFEYGQVLNIL